MTKREATSVVAGASSSAGLPTLERLEWQHRQKEIALGKKLPPSDELVRLREESQ
jgi:hypothetical protein